jgi:Predicted membrane protein
MNTNDSSFFSRQTTTTSDNPLKPDGRFGRLSMIGWYGFLNIISFFAIIALSLAVGIFNINTMALNEQFVGIFTGVSGLAYLAIIILYIYFYCVFVVRRLHDLNKAGWLLLLLFIPVINLFLYPVFIIGLRHTDRKSIRRATPCCRLGKNSGMVDDFNQCLVALGYR